MIVPELIVVLMAIYLGARLGGRRGDVGSYAGIPHPARCHSL